MTETLTRVRRLKIRGSEGRDRRGTANNEVEKVFRGIQRRESKNGNKATEVGESRSHERALCLSGVLVLSGRGAAVITCKSEACRGSTGKSFTPLMRSTRSSTRFREWKGVFRAFRNFSPPRRRDRREKHLGRSGAFLETPTTFRRNLTSRILPEKRERRERGGRDALRLVDQPHGLMTRQFGEDDRLKITVRSNATLLKSAPA